MEISYRSGKIESFRIENYKGEREFNVSLFLRNKEKEECCDERKLRE